MVRHTLGAHSRQATSQLQELWACHRRPADFSRREGIGHNCPRFLSLIQYLVTFSNSRYGDAVGGPPHLCQRALLISMIPTCRRLGTRLAPVPCRLAAPHFQSEFWRRSSRGFSFFQSTLTVRTSPLSCTSPGLAPCGLLTWRARQRVTPIRPPRMARELLAASTAASMITCDSMVEGEGSEEQ